MGAERLRQYREAKAARVRLNEVRRREMAYRRNRLPAFDWEQHGGPAGMVLALWRTRRRAVMERRRKIGSRERRAGRDDGAVT